MLVPLLAEVGAEPRSETRSAPLQAIILLRLREDPLWLQIQTRFQFKINSGLLDLYRVLILRNRINRDIK
jgi:hypothetical protein